MYFWSYPPGESAKSWGDGYAPCSQKTKDIFLLIHLHLATSLVFRLLFEKMRCCQNKCREKSAGICSHKKRPSPPNGTKAFVLPPKFGNMKFPSFPLTQGIRFGFPKRLTGSTCRHAGAVSPDLPSLFQPPPQLFRSSPILYQHLY